MAISIAQYIDLLVKKLQGVAKTAPFDQKGPSNETIASPPLLRADVIWADSGNIPNVAANISGLAQAYRGANSIQCQPDFTVVPIGGIRPTWLTNLNYWIPQEFGASWLPKVYVGPPNVANIEASGTQIFSAGSGGTGEYYFDTQAGLINFIGNTIPSVLTSGNVLYVSGYRYVGQVGISNDSYSNANVSAYLASNANITISIGTGNINTQGNVQSDYFFGNGAFLTGIPAAYSNANVANYLPTYTGELGALTGNVITTANVQGTYILGNGYYLTGISGGGGSYGNANVSNYLSSNANITILTTGPITTSANISGSYVLGNGAYLTGISALPLTVSLIDSGNIITNAVSNVEFLRFDANSGFGVENLGNGNVKISLGSTFKTWVIGNTDPNQPNLVASGEDIVQFVQGNGIVFTSNNTPTGNSYKSLTIDVDLDNYTGNITAGNIDVTGNVSASYFLGDGAFLTGIYSNANVANYLPTYTGNITAGNIDVTGNVSATYFLGNGGFLTGLYSNADVAAYLASNANILISTQNTVSANSIVISDSTLFKSFNSTSSTVGNQTIFAIAAVDVKSIDFNIVATDNSDDSRQTSKITAVRSSTNVSFVEYAGLSINNTLGNFRVVYSAPNVELQVSPSTGNTINYEIFITNY